VRAGKRPPVSGHATGPHGTHIRKRQEGRQVNFKTALAGLLANVAAGIAIALLLSCLH
jgi:hypothetical protein